MAIGIWRTPDAGRAAPLGAHFQIADELSLLVQDANVQLNRVDFSTEGVRLLRDQCGAAGADSQQGDRRPVDRLHVGADYSGESTEVAEDTD